MHPSRPHPRGLSVAIILVLAAAGFIGLLLTAAPAAAAGPFYAYGNSICKGGPTPTWLTGSTWIINATAVVGTGCTLTVQPGVTVKADPGVHLYVNGTMNADGVAGNLIDFIDNQTAVIPWSGIQFNPGATGSVSWSSFSRVQVAVTARSSSPMIANNSIALASGGIQLDSSASVVADNTINGRAIGSVGIVLVASTATVERNAINGTVVGIEATTSGSPTITNNRLTNVSGSFALGMFIDHQTTVNITGNTLQFVLANDGAPGGAGGSAAAILVNATSAVTIRQNTVETVRGGRGGRGANGTLLAGSPGGAGGAAAGIAVGAATTVTIEGNGLTGIQGGRGGDGGSSTAAAGGAGGAGGFGVGIELFSASGNVSFLTNTITGATGGNGGNGGQNGTTGSDGRGGEGSDVYGIFSLGGLNASLSGNTVQSLQGGNGGRTPAVVTPLGVGGSGGNATGIIAVVNENAVFHANAVSVLAGGTGGAGYTLGGFGGNVTGVLALGLTKTFNPAVASYNTVSSLTGGLGGVGGTLSGDGGNVSGIATLHADTSLTSNQLSLLHGGAGGVSFNINNKASRGGDAGAIVLFDVPTGSSIRDAIQTITGGAAGGTVSPRAGRGVGYYLVGNHTIQTQVQITNATISSTGTYDFYVDNYTTATALNASFSGAKVAVMAAGNLTIENYLAVRVFWPNNSTFVMNPSLVVKDDALSVFSGSLPSGQRNWIVVTNREYIDSPVPTYHKTNVSVSYGSYRFWDDPRFANMNTSHTESFGMVDTNAPDSEALPLLPYHNTWTFPVAFTDSDGNGTGVASVALWFQQDQGAWSFFQLISLPGPDSFTFTTNADGVYAFATIATDRAGNIQQPNPPTSNNTWTIVDTSPPSTHVVVLPLYETSMTFLVSWAPDAGVSDVANYAVQVNVGSGWVNWLTNTTSTSATYTATAQGPVAFRTLGTDFAGNQESKTRNDTWTIVDTIPPQVVSRSPTGSLTASPTTIVITFSEAMNTSSAQAAFSISPFVNGSFSWSNGSRTLTFQPSAGLALGTTYTVTVGTGAEDLAGNGMVLASVFTFSTPPPPPAGLALTDLWPLLVVIAVVLAAVAVFLVRRRSASGSESVAEAPKAPPPAAPAKQEAAIDDVFLLYRKDGVLIKHETRRLRPDIDTDILSGMLTAVQQFVKDSFRGEEGEELNEMTVGQMHILIGRGKWLILAATITGGDMESMTTQIQKCVQDMEDHNWDRLEDWDGDLEITKALGPYLKKLIRGEYAA